jgi:hypothetical protein
MDPLHSIRFLAGLKEADPAEPYSGIEKQTPGFASDTGMMPDHLVGDDPSYAGYADRQAQREKDNPAANEPAKDPNNTYVPHAIWHPPFADNDVAIEPKDQPGSAVTSKGNYYMGGGSKPVFYEPGPGGGDKGGSDAGASGASAGKKADKPSAKPDDSQSVTVDIVPPSEAPDFSDIDKKIAAQQQAEPTKPAPAAPPAAGTNVPEPPVLGTNQPSTWQLPSAGTPNAAPAPSNTLTVHPQPQEKPQEPSQEKPEEPKPEPAKPAVSMVKPEPSIRDLLNKLDKPKPLEPKTNIQPAPLTRSSPSQLVIPPQEKPPEPKTNMVPTLPVKPQFEIPPQQQPQPQEPSKPVTPTVPTRSNPSTLNIPAITAPGDPRGVTDKDQGADKDDGAKNGFGPKGKDAGNADRGELYGRSTGPLTSPGPLDGPGPSYLHGPTDGPDWDKRGQFKDHDWVTFRDNRTGQYVRHPDERYLGPGFQMVRPGIWVSKYPMNDPRYREEDHSRPPNVTPGKAPPEASIYHQESADLDRILRLSGQKKLVEMDSDDKSAASWFTQKPPAAEPASSAKKTTPEPGSVQDIEQGRKEQDAQNAKDVGKQVMPPDQQTQGRQQMQQPGSDIDGDIVSVGPEYLKPRYASPQAAPYYPTPPRQIIMPNRPMYPGQQHRMWAGPQTRGPQYRYDYRGPRSR